MSLAAFLSYLLVAFKQGSSENVSFLRTGPCEKKQVSSDLLLKSKSLQCLQKPVQVGSFCFLEKDASCIFLCKAAGLFPILCPHCRFSLLLSLFLFFQDPQQSYCMYINLGFLIEYSLASNDNKLSSC